jgi:hypothetical protein
MFHDNFDELESIGEVASAIANNWDSSESFLLDFIGKILVVSNCANALPVSLYLSSPIPGMQYAYGPYISSISSKGISWTPHGSNVAVNNSYQSITAS